MEFSHDSSQRFMIVTFCFVYLITNRPIDTNENFPLESGWALRSSHKYGQRGTGKRISMTVKTYLEGFFLTGNVNKTDRMFAKEMVIQLKQLAEEGEIQESEVPEIKTVEGWITRYSASLRKESAEQRVMDGSRNQESVVTSKRPENGNKNTLPRNKRQKKQ
ncbi:unnamed protein product [Rhizophagus irregularis]|nr:unnamed protein product [Rhizophagus irregularis]